MWTSPIRPPAVRLALPGRSIQTRTMSPAARRRAASAVPTSAALRNTLPRSRAVNARPRDVRRSAEARNLSSLTPASASATVHRSSPAGVTSSSRGDIRGLDDRVELLCIAALFARTVARLLSPSERHVIVESRGRQGHHDQTALSVPLEVTRVLQRRRADAGRQTERRVVGDRERLVVVLHANDGGDRPEDFLAVD